MSHVATVELEVRDLDALAAGCRRIGLELIRDQTTYRWFGRHVGDYPMPDGFTEDDLGKCDHAIRVAPGSGSHGGEEPYEIGVVRSKTGPGYALIWDFWHGGYGLEKIVGRDTGLLKQAYATEVAKRQLMRQGMQVSEQQMSDGTVRLVAR